MNGLDDVSESAHRLIFLGIVFYFAVLVYGQFTGDPLAVIAAEIIFGVIAVGVGAVLYVQAGRGRGRSAIVGAAACLVVGGLLQFAFLLTATPAIGQASSITVFAGIGLYIYAVWYAE
ncbi:hypothetical protein [Natronorubrum sulfidifaciens]|uniref:Uncharacterized protein n=1 Tax=Natronorubrum sulfidifaciens JCM 14089 TaxID=1230460 RepID=L9W4H9_9EURY|nr:hypothetical protein [Natronorubrum sulfidifaciens]ELY44374.1 hypothetical protein C495_10744 [Natronorubrum sulfidifaciens JCM 14089]